jgi:hypothetical protein
MSQPLPASTPTEVKKIEDEIAKLSRFLKTVRTDGKESLEEKKGSSAVRTALADAELRLSVHRRNIANSPAAFLQRNKAALDAARRALAHGEKHHPTDKALLSAARSAVSDLERVVKQT